MGQSLFTKTEETSRWRRVCSFEHISPKALTSCHRHCCPVLHLPSLPQMWPAQHAYPTMLNWSLLVPSDDSVHRQVFGQWSRRWTVACDRAGCSSAFVVSEGDATTTSQKCWSSCSSLWESHLLRSFHRYRSRPNCLDASDSSARPTTIRWFGKERTVLRCTEEEVREDEGNLNWDKNDWRRSTVGLSSIEIDDDGRDDDVRDALTAEDYSCWSTSIESLGRRQVCWWCLCWTASEVEHEDE